MIRFQNLILGELIIYLVLTNQTGTATKTDRVNSALLRSTSETQGQNLVTDSSNDLK